jgi:hypothetical protein
MLQYLRWSFQLTSKQHLFPLGCRFSLNFAITKNWPTTAAQFPSELFAMHNLKWGHAFGGAESVDQHAGCRSAHDHQRLLLEKSTPTCSDI